MARTYRRNDPYRKAERRPNPRKSQPLDGYAATSGDTFRRGRR